MTPVSPLKALRSRARAHARYLSAGSNLSHLQSRMKAARELSDKGGIWFVVADKPPTIADAQALGVPLVRSFTQLHAIPDGGLVYVEDRSIAAKVNRGRDSERGGDLVLWVTNADLIEDNMADIFSWRSGVERVGTASREASPDRFKLGNEPRKKVEGSGTTQVASRPSDFTFKIGGAPGLGYIVKAYQGGALAGTLVAEVPRSLSPQCQRDVQALSEKVGHKLQPLFVGWVNANTPEQGLGTQMYEEALREASRRGAVLLPASCAGKTTAPAALRIWEILKTRHTSVGDAVTRQAADSGRTAAGFPSQLDQIEFRRLEEHAHQFNGGAARVAAKFKKKKQVPKADGKGTTTVYEYSEGQVKHRHREKAKRLEKLRKSIEGLRSQVKKDIKSDDPKTRLTALAVALMDETYERVGNPNSADEGHFGVTGWQAKHVKFSDGKATITYVGKSGVSQKKTVSTSSVVSALKKAMKGKSGTDQVLCDGEDCRVLAADVNAYLKPHDITAKDIRGFHANEEVKSRLKTLRSKGGKLPEDKKEREEKLKKEFEQALEEAAEAVGHEARTLKNEYLVPGVEDDFLASGTVKTKHASTRVPQVLQKATQVVTVERDAVHRVRFRTVVRKVRAERFGPNTPLMDRPDAKVKYRMKSSRDAIAVAVYYGRSNIGGMNAFPAKYPETSKPCGADVWKLLEQYPQVEEDTGRPRWVSDGEERTNTRALRVYKAFITDESKHGMGIGKAMYKAVMAEWFDKVGPFLFMPMECSGGSGTSGMAQRVWKSLAQEFPSSGTVIAVLRRPTLPAEARVAARHLEAIIGLNNATDGDEGNLSLRGFEGLTSSLTHYEAAIVQDRSIHEVGITGTVRQATKSPAEKEDAEVERLHRPMPKLKPPRRDKRRNQVKESDPDLDTKDKDLSLNYKDSSRLAARWLKSSESTIKVLNQETGEPQWVTEEQLKGSPKYKRVEDTPSADGGKEAPSPAPSEPAPKAPVQKVDVTPVQKAERRLEKAEKHLKQVQDDTAQAQEEAAEALEAYHSSSSTDKGERSQLREVAEAKEKLAQKAEAEFVQEKKRIDKIKGQITQLKGTEATAAEKAALEKQKQEALAEVDDMVGKYLKTDPAAKAAVSRESYKEFAHLGPSALESTAKHVQQQLLSSDDEDEKEILNSILDGIELAAMVNSEPFDIEGRETPSPMMQKLSQSLVRLGGGAEMELLGLGRGLEEGSGEKIRLSVSKLSDNDLISVMGAGNPSHPFYGMAEIMWDSKSSPAQVRMARQWMESAAADSITLLEPIAMALATIEKGSPAEREGRQEEIVSLASDVYRGEAQASLAEWGEGGASSFDQGTPEAAGLPSQENLDAGRLDSWARVLAALEKQFAKAMAAAREKATALGLKLDLMQASINSGTISAVDRGSIQRAPSKGQPDPVRLKNGSVYDVTL